MKSIGILGVGQAGGNIAEIASALGFQSALINTNKRDGAVNTKVDKKFFVPGYNGAGQDRALALRAVHDHHQEMIEFVKRSFKNIKSLFVAFSTDGGTGSGMSPILIDILADQIPGIKIGAIAVIPERNVLAGNRINTAECIEELSRIENLASVFLVDNDQVRKMNPQSSKQEIYMAANQQVMEAINHIIKVTQKSSYFGNFDETDLLNILDTRGVTIIASTPITGEKTTAEVTNSVQKSWAHSIFCPVEAMGVIRAGLIYDGPERISKLINAPAIFEKIGEPVQLFEGTYLSDGDPTITTILAGLSFPTRRLLSLEESLEKNRERLQSLVNKEYSQKYKSRVSWASNLKTRRPDKPAGPLTEKLSKYQK
ncbi:cell division protein FtsZ [Bacillus marasmi]|uniref:cell division protein FtsZ n=1 Tax=Bacillus marasmi TaxID=1926279 RepID=UPI0011C907DE|nr:cell division protein FtsZ [Bacillus marasmi]